MYSRVGLKFKVELVFLELNHSCALGALYLLDYV